GKISTSITSKDLVKQGRSGRQSRLKELAVDPKLGTSDRGWIKQEMNSIERKSMRISRTGELKPQKNIRTPPGKELAHKRGKSAKDGYNYGHTNLQGTDLHKLQHKHEGYK
ncbi:MAG: polymorphic toxin type 8 domain-containing protein, partial [Alphaproteobacteria bacterium]